MTSKKSAGLKLMLWLRVLFAGTLFVGIAHGQGRHLKAGSDVNEQLQQAASGLLSQDENVDVIIQFKDQMTQQNLDRVSIRGGKFNRQLDTIKGGHFSLSRKALADLADDPDVAYVTLDRKIEMKSADR